MSKISIEKHLELHERLERLNVFEKDLLEKFILGSGRGGQKINKTASCVYLKHTPSGLEIKCQSSRSREANRYEARVRLCEYLEKMAQQELLEKQNLAEKKRRQNKKPTKKQKETMVTQKRHRSSIKSRRRVDRDQSE